MKRWLDYEIGSTVARVKARQRYELKYVLNRHNRDDLITDLLQRMTPDRFGDDAGYYPVTSLYFDTADYKAYWDKIQGHRVRRKVRVRVYGANEVTPETPAYLEIKHRDDKTLQKRRLTLSYAQAEALSDLGDLLPDLPEPDRRVAEEVVYLHRALDLRPTCVVSYDRLAFNGSEYEPALRITFDTVTKYRVHDLTLLSGLSEPNHYFLPPDWCILEVKVNRRVPYWLTEILGRHNCAFRRVSKYCAALEASAAVFDTQRITL
ncbi:MAG: polyphosphate polymerase domain-containing protein [Caldilineales bacterium]|nr:polyphosphate polymerase domain-containing protein [Caldilineales bacterium]